eukprot:COSAG05_NODE_3595_length_1971_cov_1.082843_3_plen_68_part_00
MLQMEDKERRANKGVYSTPQYRQAVERAMQRARDAEKARRKEQGMADLAGRHCMYVSRAFHAVHLFS